MLRLFCVSLLMAVAAAAQDSAPPPTLSSLEKTVMDRTAEWDRLAQNLNPVLVRLLPCDPKVNAAITEVSKASDARIAAVNAYLDAAVRDTQRQTEGARQVLASSKELNGELAAEKTDLGAERASLDGQIANLIQSSQARASLSVPTETLKQTLAMQQQRSDSLDSSINHDQASGPLLADLAMQLQARQTAWAGVRTAFDTEASHWTAYYSARLARAQLECTITKTGPASGAAASKSETKSTRSKGKKQ